MSPHCLGCLKREFTATLCTEGTGFLNFRIPVKTNLNVSCINKLNGWLADYMIMDLNVGCVNNMVG